MRVWTQSIRFPLLSAAIHPGEMKTRRSREYRNHKRRGIYFRVVRVTGLITILMTALKVLKEECAYGPETLDALIANYIYEKSAKKKRGYALCGLFPEDRMTLLNR